MKEYTGENPVGTKAVLYRKGASEICNRYALGKESFWQGGDDEKNLYLKICNCRNKNFFLALEPARMSAAFSVTVRKGDIVYCDTTIFSIPPVLGYSFEGKDLYLSIPLESFYAVRRKDFPMRMNLWSTEEEDFYWVEPCLWQSRLQYGSFNPEQAGWVIFAD